MLTQKTCWPYIVCAFLLAVFIPQQGICAEATPFAKTGTAGVLTIGPDGQTFIRFTRGYAITKIGQYIKEGVAKPVPTWLADKNPIQRASFLAVSAAQECENAKKKFARGEISAKERDWICAKAQQMAARETTAWATEFIRKNPDPAVVEWATDQKMEAEELETIAIQNGAERVAPPEAFETAETPVFATPLEPPGQTVPYLEKPASQFTP